MTDEGARELGQAVAVSSPVTAQSVGAVSTVCDGPSAVADQRPRGAEPHQVAAQSSTAPSGGRFRLGNRPPLTGIRGFAIVIVLVFHSNFSTLPGAWATMSVFFVLSGFLITAMLMGDHQRSGRISLRNFYARRAVRLLPSLALTAVLLALYAAVVSVPDAPTRIWGDLSAAAFYVADFRSASGHEPLFGYLSQAWSLSIEEQFYLVWSLLLLVAILTRRRGAAYAVALSGIGISAVYGTSLILAASHFTRALTDEVYYGFGPRADALFVGCLLGLLACDDYFERLGAVARQMLVGLAVVSAALLGWIILAVSFGSRESLLVWLPLSIVLSAVVIVYFVVHPEGAGSQFVGLTPFVLLGNLSYTLYLVHWPIFVAVSPSSTHWPFAAVEVVRLAIAATIALTSWYLVEKPLMDWRRRVMTVRRSAGGPSPAFAGGGLTHDRLAGDTVDVANSQASRGSVGIID